MKRNEKYYYKIAPCRDCDNQLARYWKLVGIDSKGVVPQFHYWRKCKNCGVKALIREKYLYDLLKDIPWNKSKRYVEKYQEVKLN